MGKKKDNRTSSMVFHTSRPHNFDCSLRFAQDPLLMLGNGYVQSYETTSYTILFPLPLL